MKIRSVLLVTVVLALLVLTACINLGTSTATRFYLLESKAEPVMATKSQSRLSNLSLVIGPVTIAAYLDRPQLVFRINGNELHVDEFHQWAEPLKANISRVIRENLSVLTHAGHVHSHLHRQSVAIDYQITLDVLQFDPNEAGSVTLKSVWRIIKPGSHQRLMEKRSTIVQPFNGTTSADVVVAMSMALAELSRQMADTLVDGLRETKNQQK